MEEIIQTISSINWGEFGLYPQSPRLVDDNNIFLAVHSMGGDIALTVLTANDNFNAASIWAGVTAGIEDVANFYTKYEVSENKSEIPLETAIERKWEKINSAAKAAPFMLEDINAMNGLFYLENPAAPVVIHQGTQDPSVHAEWSVNLHEELKKLGKESTLYLYEGNDHELSLNNEHRVAIERDVIFFQKHFKTKEL
ncbi:MAG: prolyl oligopeptidase family serine peptidase [Chloroflexi bacterium]|nr:prolyl oligopeptidase family serine peptidase [Chloroflexota bacterium]